MGREYIEGLLSSAADYGSDVSEEQKTARLSAALNAGDQLIAQFLPIAGITEADPRWGTLRQFAIDESLYYLECNTPSGASDSSHRAADRRRKDLSYMRKRQQFAGTPEGQRATVPDAVPSGSDFALDKLAGLI